MLANSAEFMDYMSEHFYVQTQPGTLSHANLAPRQVKRIADAHRKYRQTIPALKGKDIPIALDEWNYWYGPHVYGELGTQYFLKDALGIADGLHEYFRQSDIIFMANYAQTVNVIGAIKTSKTAAVLDTTGVVLELYRNHYGTIPVARSRGARAARRRRGLEGRLEKGPDRGRRQSDEDGPDASALDQGRAAAGDGQAVSGHGGGRDGLQRPGQGAGRYGQGNAGRAVREDADPSADQRLALRNRGPVEETWVSRLH